MRLSGTRTVRPWRASEARMACRIHQTAYEMNLTPWSGSNLRAAVSRPTLPSPIRSVRGNPRFWYFLATEMTKRRLRFTSSCIASWSPARTRRAMAISCCGVSRAVLLTSKRYWSRMSRSAPCTPSVLAVGTFRARRFGAGVWARISAVVSSWASFALAFLADEADFALIGARLAGSAADDADGVFFLGMARVCFRPEAEEKRAVPLDTR